MKRKLLAVAVSVGLSCAGSMARADALLFPYYAASAGKNVSFLMLANVWPVMSDIHYTWTFKDTGAAADSACMHEDAWGRLTGFDLVQQTVTDPSISGFNLKNDTGDTLSKPAYSLTDGVDGFITVSNWITQAPAGVYGQGIDKTKLAHAAPESTFTGQIIVVDIVNRTTNGQRGINNPNTNNVMVPVPPGAPAAPGINLAGLPDGLEEGAWDSAATSHPSFDLTWYPASLVDTTWHIVVTGRDMSDTSGGYWDGTVMLQQGFDQVYDRDENPRSGYATKVVRCTANLTRADLMTDAQVTHSNMGGYLWTTVLPGLIGQNNAFNAGLGPNPALGIGGAKNNQGATGAMLTKIEMTTKSGGSGGLKGAVQSISLENPWPNMPY